jgi:hypothetical protein
MLPRRHGLVAALLALACLHCPSESKDLLYEPVPLEAHDVQIAADAEGDAKSPAHVSVFLQRGVLSVKGGGAHTLEGVATGAKGDAPPRLELMQDRVALTQSTVGGAAPKGDAKFVLALGATPMTLQVDTATGEAQSIDLGGVPLKGARFHTASGHLTIDWSAPNRLPGGPVVLETESGYIEVTHLGRSGASGIDVTNVAGYVSLDTGDLGSDPSAAALGAITATVKSGKLVIKVPKDTAARATIQAPANGVTLKGWASGDAAGSFVVGDPKAVPRVTARVTALAGNVELRAE